MPLGKIMADIFLSYKRTDREKIRILVAELAKLHISVWYDAQLEAGDQFDDEIVKELYKAKAHIICWTSESVRSRWVRSEAHIGADRGIHVPIFIERCSIPPPFNLDHTQDLSDWQGDAGHPEWQSTLSRIGILLNRGAVFSQWAVIGGSSDPSRFRSFLSEFGDDALAHLAKQELYTCEIQQLKSRLRDELNIQSDEIEGADWKKLREALDQERQRAKNLENRFEVRDATLSDRISQMDSQLSDLAAMLVDAESKVASKSQELNAGQAAVQAKQNEVNDLQSKLSQRDALVLRLTSAHSKIEEQLQGTVRTSQQYLQQLNSLADRDKSFLAEKKSIEGELAELSQQLDVRTREAIDLESALQLERFAKAKIDSEYQQLKQEFESSRLNGARNQKSLLPNFGFASLKRFASMFALVLLGAAGLIVFSGLYFLGSETATLSSPSSLTMQAQVPNQVADSLGTPAGVERCVGSPEPEKCLAFERKLAAETPEQAAARRSSLEAERNRNMAVATRSVKQK